MGYDAIRVGERLQALRKSKSISQKSMAEIRSVSQSLLSKQESGTVAVDGESLSWYADFYGVTVDYILCRTDVPNIYVTTGVGQHDATVYTTEKSLSPQEQEQAAQTIDEALSGGKVAVSPEMRQAIEQIVRQVLSEQDKQV